MTIVQGRHDEFVAFLLGAKRVTYASADPGSAIVAPTLAGAHQLEYREGAWLYRDVYYGGVHFAGQETVYYQDQPVWSMVYSGGMLDESASLGGFLKAALRRVEVARPFRGPESYSEGEYAYTDTSSGTVERFWGVEVITLQGRAIYDLRYSGGVIV